jgi:hypothetical protein
VEVKEGKWKDIPQKYVVTKESNPSGHACSIFFKRKIKT